MAGVAAAAGAGGTAADRRAVDTDDGRQSAQYGQQRLHHVHRLHLQTKAKYKKDSPYSIAERRVPELIPVLGSQPAGDVSHKPGGRLPLLSTARPSNNVGCNGGQHPS